MQNFSGARAIRLSIVVMSPPAARFSVSTVISGQDLFLSVALGLAGFALNGWGIDLGWGNQLLVGSAVALVGVRLLPPLPATLAISIAAAATILRWAHPYAWLVWTIEGACLALLVRRTSPILIDFLFWLLLGGPLLYLTYGGVLGIESVPLWLVIAKQSLNGLLNIWLAEALYLVLLLVPVAARRLKLRPMPTPSFVMVALTAVALLPPPFYLWLDAERQEDLILSTSAAAARREIAQVQDFVRTWFDNRALALRVLAADTMYDGHVDVAAARLGPMVDDFDRVAVYDDRGRLVAHFPSDQAPDSPSQEPPWRAEGGQWQARPAFDGASAIASYIEITVRSPTTGLTVYARLPRKRMLEIYGSYSAGDGSAVALVSARGAVLTTVGAVDGVGFAIDRLSRAGRDLLPSLQEPQVLAPSGFGQSLMAHMQDAVLANASPLLTAANGPWVVVFQVLKPAILEARTAQLRLLLIQELFLSLAILGAAVVSHLAGTRLQALSGFVSRVVSAPPSRPRPREEPSILKELGDIDQQVDQLGGLLQSERQEALNFQERLDAIQKHAPIVIYEVGIEQGAKVRSHWVSESLGRVLGYPREAIDAPSWWTNRLHPADAQATLARFTGLRPGQVVTAEYRFRRGDGAWRWLYDVLLVSDTPEADGSLRGNGFLIDVSLRKEAEQQLIQASKLASLGAMATGVAHELNQPLNVIKIGASNLRGDLEDGVGNTEDYLQQISGIIGQVDRAAKLISHMRVFGRQPVEAAAPFDLGPVRDGLRSLIAAQLTAERIVLTFGIDDDLPPVIGHAVLLEQVLLNIVLNARDAILERRAAERDLRGFIAIVAHRADDKVVIEVEDNGTGIPAEAIDHVFEPFFTTKPIGKGTGLGLAVSYGIVRDMRGNLEAFPAAQGARFVITLPAATGDRPVQAAA